MRNDEIDEAAEDLSSDDPTSLLERLDAGFDEDLGAEHDQPVSDPPRSPREIDDFVDQVLTEELARLNGTKKKP
jgi:hypothetical protein